MIVRRYRYQCRSCGQLGELRWQESYPDARRCPVCRGTMEIHGIVDRSLAAIMRERRLLHVSSNLRG